MKTVYQDIKSKLTEAVPTLRQVSMNTGQLSVGYSENSRPPLAYPSVLIDIEVVQANLRRMIFYFNSRSRVGSDGSNVLSLEIDEEFQFTHPRGVRPFSTKILIIYDFESYVSRVGSYRLTSPQYPKIFLL